MRETLRGILEEMAQQEEAVQADLHRKVGLILAQQKQIALLDSAIQVTPNSCIILGYPTAQKILAGSVAVCE